MKYDSLKKVQSRVSYNRYLYYEPNSAKVLKSQQKEQWGLLFGLAIRLFVCGVIFGLLLFFNQTPLKNLTASIKNAVKYNQGVFAVEQVGTIPLKDKVMAVLYPDKTPLKYIHPLITQNIKYHNTYVVLILEENPLIYSSEAGLINKVTRNNGKITIEIKHRNNTLTKYEGLEFAGVSIGQTVDKNFPIGIIDDKKELIFSIIIDGKAVIDISTEVQWD